MASATGNAALSLPRFLLPRLSWTAPISPSQALRAASLPTLLPSENRRSWQVNGAASFHSPRQTPRCASRKPATGPSILQRHPGLRRSFHATAPRGRDHHFDTLKFVQRLKSEGFTEEQSVAMMKVLNDVIQERQAVPIPSSSSYPQPPPPPLTKPGSIQNLTRTMVLREDAAKATYTQKVDFAQLRSELLSADSTESNTTRIAHERLTNDITKLNNRLRDEIGRTQASVRLDLNLEKGRIREEAVSQELKIKETETKIEQEVAALREKLDQVKFQTLQWLMGVCTGFAALLLGAWRLLM
ncbi:Protein fmp32, mitochondrial [Parahypoxylon ruwenzoriense]